MMRFIVENDLSTLAVPIGKRGSCLRHAAENVGNIATLSEDWQPPEYTPFGHHIITFYME